MEEQKEGARVEFLVAIFLQLITTFLTQNYWRTEQIAALKFATEHSRTVVQAFKQSRGFKCRITANILSKIRADIVEYLSSPKNCNLVMQLM